MEQFVSQDSHSYSLYFDIKIWFRAREVTGTFEKQTPGFFPATMNVSSVYFIRKTEYK